MFGEVFFDVIIDGVDGIVFMDDLFEEFWKCMCSDSGWLQFWIFEFVDELW